MECLPQRNITRLVEIEMKPDEILEKVDQQVGGALRALGGDVKQEENGWEKNFENFPLGNRAFVKEFIREQKELSRTSALRFALEKIEGMKACCEECKLGYYQALSDLSQALTSELTKS